MVIANDATVKAGAFFPMTAKKVIRAQTIAMENHVPILYLVDSAGIFLPLQEDVFPDQDDFGRIFRNNAVTSARGIPQITAIMGMCVAGGAYLPVMTDHVLMTEGSGLFLAGPALVQAAIGQKLRRKSWVARRCTPRSPEQSTSRSPTISLPGAITVAGGEDREIADEAPFPTRRSTQRDEPKYCGGGFVCASGCGSRKTTNAYDMREVIARVVDRSEFDEYKARLWAQVLCGYARIGGCSVGIVANQKVHQPQTRIEGEKRTEFGGVIYAESAEKAARFIMDCNQNLIPLIFLHDVNGFMVGKDAEWSGIIRAGAKMVSAVFVLQWCRRSR